MGKAIEYITKDKAKELVCEFCQWAGTSNCEECEHPVDDVPAADVQPVRHGRWIIDREFGNDVMSNEQMVICSECGKGIFWGKKPYCPNCGARMDGGNIDER